jgi:site-specific DNA recombinase
VYRDLGISGGKPPEKRPGFLAMRERILATDRKHEHLVIAAYDQSRISRDNIDAFNFYKLLEGRPWLELVMHDGRFERSPSGELTWGVVALTATHLRKTTGQKIKAAYAKKNAQGVPTGPAPYGYRYVGGKRSGGTLEVDPETAPIVRRIFKLYADGDHSAATIADTLNAEGVPVSAISKGRWMGDSIAQLLQNIAYIGKTYTESRRSKTGDIIAATWPPIVGEALFFRVQDRMSKRRPTVANGGPRARDFTFRGLSGASTVIDASPLSSRTVPCTTGAARTSSRSPTGAVSRYTPSVKPNFCRGLTRSWTASSRPRSAVSGC